MEFIKDDEDKDKFNEIYNNLEITREQIFANVNCIKNVRNNFEKILLNNTAQFFTDKLITLEDQQSNGKSRNQEIYKMAKYLYEKEQYYRAAFMLTSNNLHLEHLPSRYLAAKCHFDGKEYSKSLEILNLPLQNVTFDPKEGSLNQWISSIELLKGYIYYESLNDKETANKHFMEALETDPMCYEAFQALVKFDMISKEQETQLLEILSKNPNNASINLLKQLFKCELVGLSKMAESDVQLITNRQPESKYDPENLSIASFPDHLHLLEAEDYYNNFQFNECFALLKKVYERDVLNPRCLFLMIGCLLELQNQVDLQKLSHKLVEAIPESPVAWYAVGCYYYLTSNMDNARKYFHKSTLIDPNYQPSRLMFAHSFEMEALHDQAISIYLDLTTEMAISYLPWLYVGVEYCHLNNPSMAERYLNKALKLAPDNLFVLHEYGIFCYQKKDYENAKKYLSIVYQAVSKKKFLIEFPHKWEPLMNNLGHIHRKLGNYDEAIQYYRISLQMLPNNSSAFDALGLVYSLKGDLQTACDYFQKALSIKRDDAFALTMFNLVFQSISTV